MMTEFEVDWDHTQSTAIWDTGAGVTLVDQSRARSHLDIVVISNDIGHGVDVIGAQEIIRGAHWRPAGLVIEISAIKTVASSTSRP